MQRQLLSNDVMTIRRHIAAYKQGSGGRVIALIIGLHNIQEVVEVKEVPAPRMRLDRAYLYLSQHGCPPRQPEPELWVKIRGDVQWHKPLRLFLEEKKAE